MSDELKKYANNIELMKKENITISTSSNYNNEDGAYVWAFSLKMIKEIYGIDDSDDEPKQEIVVSLSGGVIIPPWFEYDDEESINEYKSGFDLCDSISADLLLIYEAISDDDGIKKEIIKELGLRKEDQYDTPIMLVQDIESTSEKYLNLFLELFPVIKEGLPAHYCQIAAVLLDFDRENHKLETYVNNGWRLRPCTKGVVIAYKKI